MMKEYLVNRIKELEQKRNELIEIANKTMSDASAMNGAIFECQLILEKLEKDDAECQGKTE